MLPSCTVVASARVLCAPMARFANVQLTMQAVNHALGSQVCARDDNVNLFVCMMTDELYLSIS